MRSRSNFVFGPFAKSARNKPKNASHASHFLARHVFGEMPRGRHEGQQRPTSLLHADARPSASALSWMDIRPSSLASPLPRLPLSRWRSRPAPWPPWPSGARAHAAAAVLHASSQEPPLARPPWPRSRLAPPSFSPTCAVNHRSSGRRRRSRCPRVAKPPWATLG